MASYLFISSAGLLAFFLDSLKLPFMPQDVETKSTEDNFERRKIQILCLHMASKETSMTKQMVLKKKKWFSSPADIILIRRSEDTYRKWSDCNTNIYKTSCLPPLPNRLCQNLAAILFFNLKFFILKIKAVPSFHLQLLETSLPWGKMEILGSSKWCINNLGNISV